MKISILLPYKENFSPTYAGAVSLFVKDTTQLSIFKKDITIFGNTNLKKIYKLNYKNIFLKRNIIQSGSKVYVNEFLKFEKVSRSDIIEIHNRPNYFHLIEKKIAKQKIVLYFHNDPLTMTGSRSASDRKILLDKAEKIIFNSHWSKKRFLEGIEGLNINSEKMQVIYQSTNPIKVNIEKKKKWITFVGKLNKAKGYDLFGQAVIKILKKYKNWKAIVIGDEPRMTLNYKHKNLQKNDATLPFVLEKINFDKDSIVNVELEEGQISLHDVYTIHSSNYNKTNNSRKAMTMRYYPTTSVYRRDMNLGVLDTKRPIFLMRGKDISRKNEFVNV